MGGWVVYSNHHTVLYSDSLKKSACHSFETVIDSKFVNGVVHQGVVVVRKNTVMSNYTFKQIIQ